MSCLREAGELLRAVADADDRMLISRRILDVAYRLDGLRIAEQPPAVAPPVVRTQHPTAPPPAPPPPDHDADVVPIDSLAYDEEPVSEPVSILSLAPDEESEDDVVSIAALAPDAPQWALEATFRTYDRLRRERAAESPSLNGLLGRAASESVSLPVPDVQTVEIGVLCYRGRAALERAALVQQQLADELARHGGLEAIRPLLQELLDLVPLALAES